MLSVNPKKKLGQHFLSDKNIARKITDALSCEGYKHVIEIGPGLGILTQFLVENGNFSTRLIEIDYESVEYLRERFPDVTTNIVNADFLKYSLAENYSDQVAVIGNFPYNISSQIFFRIIENRHLVPEVIGMVQKEVADRIVSPPGSKVYGILSVLLQAYYKAEILFNVGPQVFIPPPKVQSAVLRLTRKQEFKLDCDDALFFRVVKTAFNQRRKMLRNSLASLLTKEFRAENREQSRANRSGNSSARTGSRPLITRTDGTTVNYDSEISGNITYHPDKFLSQRPEQLSSGDFVYLTRLIGSIS